MTAISVKLQILWHFKVDTKPQLHMPSVRAKQKSNLGLKIKAIVLVETRTKAKQQNCVG